jgi:hypothetical protein
MAVRLVEICANALRGLWDGFLILLSCPSVSTQSLRRERLHLRSIVLVHGSEWQLRLRLTLLSRLFWDKQENQA